MTWYPPSSETRKWIRPLNPWFPDLSSTYHLEGTGRPSILRSTVLKGILTSPRTSSWINEHTRINFRNESNIQNHCAEERNKGRAWLIAYKKHLASTHFISNSLFKEKMQHIIKWLSCNEHQILIPERAGTPHSCNSWPHNLIWANTSLHILHIQNTQEM